MTSNGNLQIPEEVTVAIVGAGPAGLGMARVLRDLAIPGVWVLERGRIGQSFLDWPEGTRLLTPSFPGNAFGLTDLNAISYDSSPGWSLGQEHPDGASYAAYLEQAATAFRLNVQSGIEVLKLAEGETGFVLDTDHGEIRAEYVIWAGGQFGTPSDGGIPGAELARPYPSVQRWQDVPGEEVFVIGGYESGLDAAIGLASTGKRVTVLDQAAPWDGDEKDPSRALAPHTRQRLAAALVAGGITLVANVDVVGLEQEGESIRILAGDGRSWLSPKAPILATGFDTGTAIVADWFEYGPEGLPLLTAQDESTILPGLFLVGPEVIHQDHLFCFIYKFRQRFAVVARAIAGRLGVDTEPLEHYRNNNMYLDDFECCEDDRCLC